MNSKYWSYRVAASISLGLFFFFLLPFPKGPLSAFNPITFPDIFPLLCLCGPSPASLHRWEKQETSWTLRDLFSPLSSHAGSEEELEELCEQAV